MNYTIIKDQDKLLEFIQWLPELKENECYYLCLFARNKYVRDTPEYFPHIKSDKAQVRRFISNKKDLFNKIKQLEVEIGSYKTKENFGVPQDSLALYISVNPRSQLKATRILLTVCADLIIKQNTGYNIATEALSAIQKSVGSKYYFDLDIDLKDKSELNRAMYDVLGCVNKEAVTFIETRGGLHALIEYKKIDEKYVKNWYQNVCKIQGADIQSDNMIPVIGCVQGNFIPKLIKMSEIQLQLTLHDSD